jgi:HSP20 family protein
MSSREPQWAASPARMLERFAEEMDSLFEDFGLGRNWPGARFARRWLTTPFRSGMDLWAPEIQVTQQASELVVRADLPGMKKDDVCDPCPAPRDQRGRRREEVRW